MGCENVCGGNACGKDVTVNRLMMKILGMVKYNIVVMHRVCRVIEKTKGYEVGVTWIES